MYGYPKIWTSLLQQEWWLSATGSQRLTYLMLIMAAKEKGDCDVFSVRSWRTLGDYVGLESRTVRAAVEHWVDIGEAKICENSTGTITITLINYMKNQVRRNYSVCKNPQLTETKTKTKTKTRTETKSIGGTFVPVGPTPGSVVFKVYSDAYQKRYGEPPVRNKKTNSLAKQFYERLGEEALNVIAFYLTHGSSWYIQQAHSLDAAVRDAEKLRTEWASGRKITATASREGDIAAYNREQVKLYLEKKEIQNAG